MTEPLLRELIDIPEAVHRSDFVISLADGIDKPRETVEHYVVTDQLVDCFDRALGLIDATLASGGSKGAYLHGSFGAGKSHFMAVLSLLLDGDPHARAIPELSSVIAKYDPRLQGRRFLLVPYHMVGAASMEAGILGGYVDHVRRLHPDAPVPGVYLDDALLDSAHALRTKMGDEAFFAGLGGSGTDEGFGDLVGGWDAQRFDDAVRDRSGPGERSALVSDLIAAYYPHDAVYAESSGRGYVPFADGLAAISRHAKGLGYDAVILFLDELILWFASRMADPTFVNEEGPKVAKLVEATTAERPAPIASFIARQRDLRDFVGQGVPGAERLNFGEILQYWEGRFDVIELSDTNLRAIVEQRLLRPRTTAAKAVIDEAFERVTAGAGRAALDTLMTSDADRAAFRRVYPFSPALIDALVAVSAYLQRERTALRLLLQLLVDHRDRLTVGDLVPVGDLFDVIRTGEEPFSDELKRHFVRARDLLEHTLRPLLLAQYQLTEEQVEALPDSHGFRTDERLAKTLLLAALVPTAGPLHNLTVRRLADLNHGTITSPVPGAEKAAVLSKLHTWQPDVPELRLEGDEQDPTVGLQLTGIDVQGILDQAAGVDNEGARRAKIREVLAAALGMEVAGGLVPETYTCVWRGSRRTVDVRFANVRDTTDIPDSELRAADRPRVVVDFPFDQPGHGPADDLVRVESLQEADRPSPTVCWLPLLFTEEALDRLGRLVVLDHVLTGDRFDGVTTHLAPQDRVEARHLLANQAHSLRDQLKDVLRQAYGLEAPDERWVRTDIRPREQLPSLDPTLAVRPPTAATLTGGFEQVLDQLLTHLYPAHPQFEEEIRAPDLRTALRHVERAVGQRDGRVDVPQTDRRAVRKVLGPLKLATTGEAHLVLDRHWRDHFHRKQAEHPGVPVTVELLRRWIDEPRPMGLDPRTANLVVAAYALADDRVLLLAGRPVEVTVDRLDPGTEVRTQQLPDENEWETAKDRAAKVFGVPASPLRSAAGVAALVTGVSEVAAAHAEACRRLVDQLEAAAIRLGADRDADRLRTARAGRDLVEGLMSAADVDGVRLLVAAAVPTTAEALGRSIRSAAQVSEALSKVNWGLVDAARTLGGESATQAAGIGKRLVAALQRDEAVQPLGAALRDEERHATDLLTAAAAAGRPPASPPPAPAPTPPPASVTIEIDGYGPLEASGSRSGLSGEDARRLLRALDDDRLQTVDVSWTLSDR